MRTTQTVVFIDYDTEEVSSAYRPQVPVNSKNDNPKVYLDPIDNIKTFRMVIDGDYTEEISVGIAMYTLQSIKSSGTQFNVTPAKPVEPLHVTDMGTMENVLEDKYISDELEALIQEAIDIYDDEDED